MFFHDANTAVFTKAEAKALAAFASTDETRLHLNAICIDFAKGSAVTTDGHRLAKSNSAACFDGADQCLVPLDAWRRAISACKKAKHGIKVQRVGREVTLTAVDASTVTLASFADADPGPFALATVKAIAPDVKFPPYDQVIPDMAAQHADETQCWEDSKRGMVPRTKSFGMNMRYLGDIALVSVAAGNARTEGAELHPGPGPLDPLVAICNGPEGSWTVVVMPMRI